MKEPILVISDDVDLFESVRAAERYLEAPEIRTGVTVLDAAGRLLRAVVVRKLLAEVVVLEEDPEAPINVAALRAGLTRLVVGRGRLPAESVAHLPLEQLIMRASQHITR
jgi:hypothetical protein